MLVLAVTLCGYCIITVICYYSGSNIFLQNHQKENFISSSRTSWKSSCAEADQKKCLKSEGEQKNFFKEKAGKLLSCLDNRKKYKDEHSGLIKGNIDSNINIIINNIIQKKEAATRNILKYVKTKKNPNLRHKVLKKIKQG